MKNALALLQSLPLYGLTSFRQITTLIKGYLYGNENISLGLYQSLCSLFHSQTQFIMQTSLLARLHPSMSGLPFGHKRTIPIACTFLSVALEFYLLATK